MQEATKGRSVVSQQEVKLGRCLVTLQLLEDNTLSISYPANLRTELHAIPTSKVTFLGPFGIFIKCAAFSRLFFN